MYATAEFNFGTTENGWLMFGNSLIRGLFLIFAFPKIISAGRKWFNRQPNESGSAPQPSEGELPMEPGEIATGVVEDVPQEPINPPEAEEEDSGTEFDLLFVRWSLVVDSLVTALAGFSRHGWQAYLGECVFHDV
jgi:hypothetical protein